jgi:hypothetical protein
MNQATDIFVDFSTKVRLVLEYLSRDAVLGALRDLAEGRETLVNGAVISPLAGLGQQRSENAPNRDYRETMTRLLTWGMRNFLTGPSVSGVHLWTSMSMLDGPRGYAQK